MSENRRDFMKLTGTPVVVYGQTEVTHDLYDAREAAGAQTIFEVDDVAPRRPELQHVGPVRERRRELVDMPPHAAAPAVADEHDLGPRGRGEALERALGIVGHGRGRGAAALPRRGAARAGL